MDVCWIQHLNDAVSERMCSFEKEHPTYHKTTQACQDDLFVVTPSFYPSNKRQHGVFYRLGSPFVIRHDAAAIRGWVMVQSGGKFRSVD